jgi:hypothetical protein
VLDFWNCRYHAERQELDRKGNVPHAVVKTGGYMVST